MDREDQDEANSHTDNSKSYNRVNDRNEQAAFEKWGQSNNNAEYGNPQFYHEPPRQQQYYQQQQEQAVGYSQVYAPPFAHPQQYIPQPVYHQPVYQQSYMMSPQPPQQVYYIPNYPRIEYPLRPLNTPNHPSLPPFPPQPLQLVN